jgi:hypothetical protein
MGNNDFGAVRFRQSIADFPLTVAIGKKTPVFGLERWRGDSPLRFIPAVDEGFTLRGDKKRLLYKGLRQSHRFTILEDGAFEYDCILHREPDTNIVTIHLEGAEKFDFLRQPDFVENPFLKGSYAVYKKETIIGEGTGKLCHINRPLIIDAMGRKVWGDLSIVGNELRIAIPEKWLSEAKYPVIVDPTIGTTTVGSQITGTDPNNSGNDRPWLEGEYALNKYQVPSNGNGTCTAYVYCYSNEVDSEVKPCLYTNVNNKPYMKKSQNENYVNVEVWPPSYPVGWRSNTFVINGNITAGEYVWFGILSRFFTTRFDYGGECYKGWFDWELYWNYEGDPTPYINANNIGTYCTIKWSWYFTYTASVTAQNFSRTLTQGVNLSDTKKMAREIKRTATQEVNAGADLFSLPILIRSIFDHAGLFLNITQNRELTRVCGQTADLSGDLEREQSLIRELKDNGNAGISGINEHIADYQRLETDTVNGSTVFNNVFSFFRKCAAIAANVASPERIQSIIRLILDEGQINDEAATKRELKRKFEDETAVCGEAERSHGFFRTIIESIETADCVYFPVLFTRTLQENVNTADIFSMWRFYVRGLYIEAGSMAEIERHGDYYRSECDTVQADGSAIRQLFIFLKILTTSFARDFILRRFLIAKEELALKSCVTMELTLESKIN